MKDPSSTLEPADAVELRIERRRAQLLRDWDETRAYVAQRNRWTPLAAAAAVAALGFGLARQRPAPFSAETPAVDARRGMFAALAAMIGAAARFALSPTGRALWASWKERRRGTRPRPTP